MSASLAPSSAVLAALSVAKQAVDPACWRAERAPLARIHVAIGDPQAPLLKFFQILEYHGLLDGHGWLRPEVHLVSMGDHFDYGSYSQRETASRDGLQLLSWLSAHPRDQVTLVLGNHDLSRVGELAAFDQGAFERASSEANSLYTRRHQVSAAEYQRLQTEFVQRYPALPSVEIAARDLAAFDPGQRDLVSLLLQTGRFQLAAHVGPTLLCHAGVTREHLDVLGLAASEQHDAALVAAALNRALHDAVQAWLNSPDQPLDIPGLHRSGSAALGEGGGLLLHRCAQPVPSEGPDEPLDLFARRYDPRRLPRDLVQVIGHVRDSKCRQLLHTWVVDLPGADGALRTLTVKGEHVSYERGTPPLDGADSALLFTDGAMSSAAVENYELLDLTTLHAFRCSPS